MHGESVAMLAGDLAQPWDERGVEACGILVERL